MNYWVIKARPDQNDFSTFPAKGRSERWHTARMPKAWSPGDLLFIWAGAPLLQVIGLAELLVTNDGYDHGAWHFRVRYLSNPFEGPSIEALRRNSVFRGASFLRAGPSGTVFPLTERQGLVLRASVDGFSSGVRRARTTASEEAVARRTLGAGFGTPEQNERVERAAVRAAEAHLARAGWRVRSVEASKVGYDLHCARRGELLRVEVKGIRGTEPRFILTAGEYRRSQTDPAFALSVVTSALRGPRVLMIRQGELRDRLRITPLAFKAEIAK